MTVKTTALRGEPCGVNPAGPLTPLTMLRLALYTACRGVKTCWMASAGKLRGNTHPVGKNLNGRRKWLFSLYQFYGHLRRQNVAVHRFSRCFNTSTSGVQRKSRHGKRGKRPRRVGPAGQLFHRHRPTQCSYKFSELSILVFTITQVNIYRHPIKLIQGKQPFSPPILVITL